MIAQLTGSIIAKNGLAVIIDVNGVGYEVLTSMANLDHLATIGSKVTLHTYLLVREDAHTLYGFLQLAEKTLFCELIKIAGVGGKLALSILSHLNVVQFVTLINLEDHLKLTKIPGVGQKTAQRLILEMRSMINKKFPLELLNETKSGSEIGLPNRMLSPNLVEDAKDALIALGYRTKEAVSAINKILQVLQGEPEHYKLLTSEELIKAALKNLSKVCC